MNIDKCKEPEIGTMLHAYELGALSEEDTERFEVHLLKCRYCFDSVKQFETTAGLLRHDGSVKEEAASVGSETTELSLLHRSLKFLWPERPLVLKPALALLVILALIYPAYLGLSGEITNCIRPVGSITLLPLRTMMTDTYSLSSGKDLVLSFVFDNAEPNTKYRLTIKDAGGNVIYGDDAFADFDNFQTGRIFIPNSVLRAGRYHLTVEVPRADTLIKGPEYYFEVKP